MSSEPLPIFRGGKMAIAQQTLDQRRRTAASVLSQIILDNTSAADQIPKDARGRFLTGDGTVFQGYLFDEERF